MLFACQIIGFVINETIRVPIKGSIISGWTVVQWMVGAGCPRSSDPFCIVTYDIKWVSTYWTDGYMRDGPDIKVTGYPAYVTILCIYKQYCPILIVYSI